MYLYQSTILKMLENLFFFSSKVTFTHPIVFTVFGNKGKQNLIPIKGMIGIIPIKGMLNYSKNRVS